MLDKIQSLILLDISILFSKEINGFSIKLIHNNNEEFVVLPYCHLTENKIIKYIDFMTEKILIKKGK